MSRSRCTHWSLLELTVFIWICVSLWALLGPVSAPQYCPFSHGRDWSGQYLVAVCTITGFVVAIAFALLVLTLGNLLLRNSPISLTMFPVDFFSRRAIGKAIGELIVTAIIIVLIVVFVAPVLRDH